MNEFFTEDTCSFIPTLLSTARVIWNLCDSQKNNLLQHVVLVGIYVWVSFRQDSWREFVCHLLEQDLTDRAGTTQACVIFQHPPLVLMAKIRLAYTGNEQYQPASLPPWWLSCLSVCLSKGPLPVLTKTQEIWLHSAESARNFLLSLSAVCLVAFRSLLSLSEPEKSQSWETWVNMLQTDEWSLCLAAESEFLPADWSLFASSQLGKISDLVILPVSRTLLPLHPLIKFLLDNGHGERERGVGRTGSNSRHLLRYRSQTDGLITAAAPSGRSTGQTHSHRLACTYTNCTAIFTDSTTWIRCSKITCEQYVVWEYYLRIIVNITNIYWHKYYDDVLLQCSMLQIQHDWSIQL